MPVEHGSFPEVCFVHAQHYGNWVDLDSFWTHLHVQSQHGVTDKGEQSRHNPIENDM